MLRIFKFLKKIQRIDTALKIVIFLFINDLHSMCERLKFKRPNNESKIRHKRKIEQ